MKKYNSKDIYFIRFGDLNLVYQDGYKPHEEIDEGELDEDIDYNYSFHTPPSRYGIYAFPIGGFELYLIGGYNNDNKKNGRYIIYDSDMEYDIVNKRHIKGIKRLLKNKNNIKWFRSEYIRLCDNDCDNCEYNNSYMCYKQAKVINYSFKRYKKFKYYGNIWHHLKHNIVNNTLILDEHRDWVLTSFNTWLNCYNNELTSIRLQKQKTGIPISKDHLEVFISNKIKE